MDTTYTAKIAPGWIRSMLMKSALFFAFASWFLYDGLYAWPKKTKAALAYTAFVEAGNSKHDWPAHAEKLGLGKVKPEYDAHEDVKSPRQITEQFVWAGGLCAFALGFLVKIVMDRNKVLSYDATALISPEGKRVELTSIQEIATEKWDKKGLAYIRYKEGAELKKLTIDDLKYDGAEKVLERAQAHHGVPLESEKRAARKAAEAAAEAEDTEPPSGQA